MGALPPSARTGYALVHKRPPHPGAAKKRGNAMLRRWVVAGMFAAVALLPAGASAQRDPATEWVGVWARPPRPNPPAPAQVPALPVPLGVAPRAPEALVLPRPVIVNPGNLPIELAQGDLANLTIRQVVRVSVGGNRLRLRFSNEGGVAPGGATPRPVRLHKEHH